MEADEVRTVGDLRTARGVFQQVIARHHGRIANTAGDGLIAEFPSVVEAVQYAVEVWRELADDTQSDLRFRIGIHLGDVLVDGDDLLGEGVNLAARLQGMADPGGILISRQVYDQVQKKLSVGFSHLGERQPKNFEGSVSTASARATAKQPIERALGDRGRQQALLVQVDRAGSRGAQRWVVILAVLLVFDLMTGDGFWVQWPAIGIALMLAVRSQPAFERS